MSEGWTRYFDLGVGLQTNNLQIGMSILNSPCAALCGGSESNLSSYFAMLDCHERERKRERGREFIWLVGVAR